ncbi:hypothetical protein FPQ18DRAFT_306497 [Pyronema domesticum]|nr:hypothetical protein FPQ18DRAFT_306497 [Pyronema domesticum]
MLSVNSNRIISTGIDPYCDFGEPNGPPLWVQHILLLCPCYTAHRLDASEACPVPIETPLFLHTDKAVDQLVRRIRDTDVGRRRYRLRREALLNGEEDGPSQFGQEWPKIGRTRKNGKEIGTRNRCLNGGTRRETGRRTSPEKERPEMPWRRKRSETRTAGTALTGV